MSFRQYVGARYVPLPDGTWDATKNYEPLTIVDDSNGNSYTSKKDVPAGTPLTNREYWQLSSSFSGAVEQLRRDLQTTQGDVSGLQTDVSGLQTDVSGLQTDVTDLNTKISQFDGRIKRAVCVTDSYGTHSPNNWMAWLKNMLAISSPSGFYMFAEGGAGFEHAGNQGNTYLSLLQANAGSITDKRTIDAVFIGGGTNDFYYLSSGFAAKFNETCEYVKTNFPKAKLYICFMGFMTEMDNELRNKYIKTMSLFSSLATKNGAVYVNAGVPMHISSCREDAQHPNNAGNEAIASEIFNAVMGGTSPITGTGLYSDEQYVRIPITAGGVISSITAQRMNHYVSGNVTVLNILGGNVVYASDQTIAFASPVPIFRFEKLYPRLPDTCAVTTVIQTQATGGGFVDLTVEVFMRECPDDNTKWECVISSRDRNTRAAGALSIPFITITIPTDQF